MMFKMEAIDLELDSSFETPFRGRSNTWPLPRPDMDTFGELEKCDSGGDMMNDHMSLVASGGEAVIPTTTQDAAALDQASSGQNGGPKKNTSRRNAWGNMSYADLITQAIQGSPDKRL